VPTFRGDAIEPGKTLGTGGYGIVREGTVFIDPEYEQEEEKGGS
jgi:hypothetical protein